MSSFGGSVVQVMSKEEFLETIKSGIVVVFFYSVKCERCLTKSFIGFSRLKINFFFILSKSDSDSSKVVGLNYEELAKLYNEYTFLKVDIYDLPAVAEYEDVCAVPSFFVYRGGISVDQYIGSLKNKLQNLVQKHLGHRMFD